MASALEKSLRKLLDSYAKMLHVDDYSIRMTVSTKSRGSDDFNTYAHVTTDEETRSVALFLNKRLLLAEPHEVDNTIIHELLHVRLNEMLSLVEDIITKHVHDKKAQSVYVMQLEKLEHKVILALTDALAKDTNEQ